LVTSLSSPDAKLEIGQKQGFQPIFFAESNQFHAICVMAAHPGKEQKPVQRLVAARSAAYDSEK
jgi:hypothetical protein